MKLLFCIKALNNAGGGAERVLATVASGLVQRGHPVAVLTFDPPGGQPYYPLDRDIQRIDLGLGATTEPSNVPLTLRRMLLIRSSVRTYSPEAVVAFMHSMFIPLGMAVVGLRVPLIASEHTSYQHYADRRLQRFLLRLVPQLADLITCVSEQVRQTYPYFLRRRMIIVPNPVTMTVSASSLNLGRGSCCCL